MLKKHTPTHPALPNKFPVSSDWPAHKRLSQHRSPRHQSALSGFQLTVSVTSNVNMGINYAECDMAVYACDVAEVTGGNRRGVSGVSGAVFQRPLGAG